MSCKTAPRSSGRTTDATTQTANAVRRIIRRDPADTAQDGRTYKLFPRGRTVALANAADGRHYAAEVLCDMPGGRTLVQLLGSTVARWGWQTDQPRRVLAEVR